MYTFVNVGTVEEKKWWLKVTLEEFLKDEDKFEDVLNYFHKKYIKEDGIIYVNSYGGCNSFMGDDSDEVVQSSWFPEVRGRNINGKIKVVSQHNEWE